MKIIVFLSIILLTACGQHQEQKANTQLEYKPLNDWLVKQKKDLNDSMIIIPNVGCTGCISSAQRYFFSNINNQNNLFIFTKIADLKMFKQVVQEDLWTRNNVLIDSNDFLVDFGIDSIYPLLIQETKSGKLNISNFQP